MQILNFYSFILFVFLFIMVNSENANIKPSPGLTAWLTDSFSNSLRIVTRTVGNILNIQNTVTPLLCNLRTDELIRHYGYDAETHDVITKDGYILTLFRCNAKQNSNRGKKAVFLQHGLLSSSDDFCTNIPDQALPYILADAGYDVWLGNSRGNTYSRRHISKDPDDPLSSFWHFSWYEMAVYDHPAVIDYILEQTDNSKLYYIGHSQGTTTLMVLLSEKPEYNDKIAAASLMAPVAYMNNTEWILHTLTYGRSFLELFNGNEFLPRGTGRISASLCELDLTNFCTRTLNMIFGPSETQKNEVMLPSLLCHTPSGSSINQFYHYGLEIRYGYFGKYMRGSEIPSDFQLSNIKTPISLHFSPQDTLTKPADVNRLIPQLNSLAFVQNISMIDFNHIDFLWGKDAASLIYSKIQRFFRKH